MADEQGSGTFTSLRDRLRGLDEQVSAASAALESRLENEWRLALTSDKRGLNWPDSHTSHADPRSRDAYVDYGRTLGKLRRDPGPRLIVLKQQLDTWRIRATQEARASLAAEQSLLLAQINDGLMPVAERLEALRRRRTEIRALPDSGLARISIRALSATILLAVAVALVCAEFALARQITSDALGLERAVARGAYWFWTPVNLFAVALCALTLPFKLLADRVYDGCRESGRCRSIWLGSLVALSFVLVCTVGWMRGNESYRLALDALYSAATLAADAEPAPAPGIPIGPTSSAFGPTDPVTLMPARAVFLWVFLVAGVLFPLAGGAALSKSRGPVADVVRGATLKLTLLCIPLREWVAGWALRRHWKALSGSLDSCMRRVARVGPHAGLVPCLSMIAGQVRLIEAAAAEDLDAAGKALVHGDGINSARLLRAAIERAALVDLPPERAAGIRPLIAFVSHAIEATEHGLLLDQVADNLSRKVEADVRLGYDNGVRTASEVLAGASAEELYWLETHMRIHADAFGDPG